MVLYVSLTMAETLFSLLWGAVGQLSTAVCYVAKRNLTRKTWGANSKKNRGCVWKDLNCESWMWSATFIFYIVGDWTRILLRNKTVEEKTATLKIALWLLQLGYKVVTRMCSSFFWYNAHCQSLHMLLFPFHIHLSLAYTKEYVDKNMCWEALN